MLNSKVKYKFLTSILKMVVPVALSMLLLAVLTELFTQPLEPLNEFLFQVVADIGVLSLIFAVSAIVITMFAGRFVAAVYGLSGREEGIETVIRLIFGKHAFGPLAIVNGGQLTRGLDSVVTKLGGPGGLIIHNDSAVVLEKRGKFSRNIAGPGLKNLEPFEKIYDVIDLRPKRAPLSVKAMTKEGIPVIWDLEICYQIDDGQQQPSQERPYPFSSDAVFKAATSKWRREMGRTQDVDWEGWIVNQTEGTLRAIIARRSLDELIGFAAQSTVAAREAIQQELAAAIGETVKKVGAQLANIRLYSLAVDDKVTAQLIKSWEARWQNWSTDKLAQEEARRIQKYEQDKASAHIEGLVELTQELDKMEQPDRIVALMRLTSVLDQGTMGAGTHVFFPGQAMELLEHILESTADLEAEKTVRKPVKRNGTVSEKGSGAITHVESTGKILSFPIVGEAAAGKEKPASDDIIGYVWQSGEMEFRAEGEVGDQLLEAKSLKRSQLVFQDEYSYLVVPISGDSMDLAGVCPGDYVIVKKSVPQNRDIAMVVLRDEGDNDQAILKRIIFGHDGVTLKSESSNPANESRTVPRSAFGGDMPAVAFVGIAEAVLKPVAA
jgi:regulator of protease activity HflC (stomatin/prohibitin superfamily)